MPLRFNKEERDEWRSRMAGKSHTCEACCAGNCKDCSGTCDCKDCHKSGSNASVLDALESKTAEIQEGVEPVVEQGGPDWGGAMEQPRVEPQAAPASEQCAHCGTPLPYAGPRGNRYCPNCHAEHDPLGRPIGGAPAAAAPGHPREGEPLSMHDEPARWAATKRADASMPPEAPPYQQKETALPYNPAAYEGQVEDMHPAAQYTYQRAVAQGSDPQAAYQAAQEKQGEMGKRTQEGQNTEGVQIPVINTSYHGDHTGFVSAATIKRVSHLL